MEVVVQDEKQTPSITTLSPKQQRFVHLYVTGQYKLPQLAELLGVHYATVSGWLKRSDVKEFIMSFQQEEHELIELAIKNQRIKAIQKVTELIDSPIDGVALSACKDILDRSGHKSIQKVEKKVEITTYEEKMKELLNVIDVEDYEEG